MKVEDRARLPILSVDAALAAVLAEAAPIPVEMIPLAEAPGRYLAEEIRASSDMPPFDRTAMDGYAVRSQDAARPPVDLEVIEEIPAGHDPRREVGAKQASRIMTGAAIPAGADAVVMVEETAAIDEGRRVRILSAASPGQHIRRAGEDLRRGEILISPGAFLGAPEIALLAAEGRSRVPVFGVPTVAAASTGDELVPVESEIGGSRIRETNSWSLMVLLRRMGIEPRRLGIVKDDRGALAAAIAEGARSDVLILSGGVSMGEYDLVGAALKEAGCRAVFERVAIQPGKPLFFGVVEGGGAAAAANDPGAPARRGAPPEASPSDRSARRTLVFGLPGNPVSSIVDFLVFARPALMKLMGSRAPVAPLTAAALLEPLRRKPGRRAYLPARVTIGANGSLGARLLPSMGSADLVALSRANALAVVRESEGDLAAGASVRVLLLDDPFLR